MPAVLRNSDYFGQDRTLVRLLGMCNLDEKKREEKSSSSNKAEYVL
jgi:hypothetical protein